MGEEPEFSIEIVLKTADARSYNGIRCVAVSFPPASASWMLTSEDHPNGTNLLLLGQFNLTDSFPVENGLNYTEDAIVEMRNLRFEDDGTFVCNVTNGIAEASRVFRLRVKCMMQTHCLLSISCTAPSHFPQLTYAPSGRLWGLSVCSPW